MFKITEFVDANTIWPTAKNYVDKGYVEGCVRGYNIEVKHLDDSTHWLSCVWITSNPEQVFNNEFYSWYFNDNTWEPTGRICFRGYGYEEYDGDDHESYVVPVSI